MSEVAESISKVIQYSTGLNGNNIPFYPLLPFAGAFALIKLGDYAVNYFKENYLGIHSNAQVQPQSAVAGI